MFILFLNCREVRVDVDVDIRVTFLPLKTHTHTHTKGCPPKLQWTLLEQLREGLNCMRAIERITGLFSQSLGHDLLFFNFLKFYAGKNNSLSSWHNTSTMGITSPVPCWRFHPGFIIVCCVFLESKHNSIHRSTGTSNIQNKSGIAETGSFYLQSKNTNFYLIFVQSCNFLRMMT